MIEKILFSLIAFLLFAYIFIFKLIRKNDTAYLFILISQAVGILINFIQILFNISAGGILKIIVYILCLIIPTIVLILEKVGMNFTELVYMSISKILLAFDNRKKAKEFLINLVAKYDKSYMGHKMLAEIYEKEGGMRKAIDEYVKVLDIKGDDYKSYFKISQLLNDLGKKNEAMQMLTNLLKKKPELYEASKMLGELLLDKEKFKEAAHVYVQAIKYNTDKADLYYNLGIAYSRLNEFSLAKECYKKATDINPNLYNAYYRLGQISLLYRDIDSAEAYFMQSIDEDMELKSYYQLAKIYMMKNDKNKATLFLNKATVASNYFYEMASKEPIFFAIKKQIIKPEIEEENRPEESEKERTISEYLDNTYNLTKILNEKENKKNNNTFKL